jgi:hypothetical protein
MSHHTAAFINALAEEGTKAEAIEWLQKTWNENCELRERVAILEAELRVAYKLPKAIDDAFDHQPPDGAQT